MVNDGTKSEKFMENVNSNLNIKTSVTFHVLYQFIDMFAWILGCMEEYHFLL